MEVTAGYCFPDYRLKCTDSTVGVYRLAENLVDINASNMIASIMISLIKYLFSEAVKTYRQEGLSSLFNKTRVLIKRNIDYIKFLINKILYRNTVYEQNGIRVDLDFDQFNKQTKSNFMANSFNPDLPEIANILEDHTHKYDFIELGGGSGYTSCYFNQFVDEGNDHVTVEANPIMIEVLLDTKSKNKCNFQVWSAAYSSEEGVSELSIKDSFAKSGTVENLDSSVVVTCANVSLKTIVSRMGTEDFVLYCNAEGIEYELIKKELELINNNCSFIVVSLHSMTDEEPDEYIQLLEKNNFECVSEIGNFYLFNNMKR